MNSNRFRYITARFPKLCIAVVGDFCLDRYLEIDPSKRERSIETGLPVHNVVKVRSQPGGAGTILNNLCALGVGRIYPIGFAGEDGEGFELRRALAAKDGVRLDGFLETRHRRTFTYCKPLVIRAGRPPHELNRLDSKNWTETPPAVQRQIIASVQRLAARVKAIIILDQVDLAQTGVITHKLLAAIRRISQMRPDLLIIADSRRGLMDYPPVCFKMNTAELCALTGIGKGATIEQVKTAATKLAQKNRQKVFVTMAERGIVGASPDGLVEHVPAFPLRGEIDIVGAGDAVTANLASAMAAGADMREALELAMAAASIVIHQLGTTGTATPRQIERLLKASGRFGAG
jgi:rfaE bifunctional protein kinase chain/domain